MELGYSNSTEVHRRLSTPKNITKKGRAWSVASQNETIKIIKITNISLMKTCHSFDLLSPMPSAVTPCYWMENKWLCSTKPQDQLIRLSSWIKFSTKPPKTDAEKRSGAMWNILSAKAWFCLWDPLSSRLGRGIVALALVAFPHSTWNLVPALAPAFLHFLWKSNLVLTHTLTIYGIYPLVIKHNYGKSPCLMGKSTINIYFYGHFQ